VTRSPRACADSSTGGLAERVTECVWAAGHPLLDQQMCAAWPDRGQVGHAEHCGPPRRRGASVRHVGHAAPMPRPPRRRPAPARRAAARIRLAAASRADSPPETTWRAPEVSPGWPRAAARRSRPAQAPPAAPSPDSSSPAAAASRRRQRGAPVLHPEPRIFLDEALELLRAAGAPPKRAASAPAGPPPATGALMSPRSVVRVIRSSAAATSCRWARMAATDRLLAFELDDRSSRASICSSRSGSKTARSRSARARPTTSST